MEAQQINEHIGIFVVAELGSVLLPGADTPEESWLEAEFRAKRVSQRLLGSVLPNRIPVEKLGSQLVRLLFE